MIQSGVRLVLCVRDKEAVYVPAMKPLFEVLGER
jgi:hypothetical protein